MFSFHKENKKKGQQVKEEEQYNKRKKENKKKGGAAAGVCCFFVEKHLKNRIEEKRGSDVVASSCAILVTVVFMHKTQVSSLRSTDRGSASDCFSCHPPASIALAHIITTGRCYSCTIQQCAYLKTPEKIILAEDESKKRENDLFRSCWVVVMVGNWCNISPFPWPIEGTAMK